MGRRVLTATLGMSADAAELLKDNRRNNNLRTFDGTVTDMSVDRLQVMAEAFVEQDAPVQDKAKAVRKSFPQA